MTAVCCIVWCDLMASSLLHAYVKTLCQHSHIFEALIIDIQHVNFVKEYTVHYKILPWDVSWTTDYVLIRFFSTETYLKEFFLQPRNCL